MFCLSCNKSGHIACTPFWRSTVGFWAPFLICFVDISEEKPADSEQKPADEKKPEPAPAPEPEPAKPKETKVEETKPDETKKEAANTEAKADGDATTGADETQEEARAE